jgi:hypothetical protein
MWEADQTRVEALAGRIDTLWHRTWRARTVVERLTRRGGRAIDAAPALPYQHGDAIVDAIDDGLVESR